MRWALFASAMQDPWREAMLDGAFECAWGICDDVLQQRSGVTCAHLPYHLRWVWDGTPLAGRDVLVRCYHGLGDTLQFIRFVPWLAVLARSVTVEAQPELLPLLKSLRSEVRLCPLGEAPAPDEGVAIESMEVPHALRLTLADLPGPVPYLATPPRRGMAHATQSRRLAVGLVWGGGDWRCERSIHPATLLPLTALPIDVVGLQLGRARHDPAAAPLRRALAGMIPEDVTILDTARLIERLDLVITIDTMVAHLAGALGRPVWTLLDAHADWRWMRDRCDSPWYPTMRLFRQSRPGDWSPVIGNVARALVDWRERDRQCPVESTTPSAALSWSK